MNRLSFVWVLVISILLLQSPRALAQQASGKAYEAGLDFGTLIPSRNGLMEMVPGWGLRAGIPTGKGYFEVHAFSGIGNGIVYRSAVVDFRLDVAIETINSHFLLGFHGDQYDQATPPASSRFAGGWHYGGGISQPIAGPVLARFDFRHRFSPGQVVEITLGLTYRFSSGG